MIKINLLGEVKPVNSSNRLWIAGYIASVVLLSCVAAFSYLSLGNSLSELTEDNALLQAQLDNLKKQTKSVADLEKKRKDLEDKLRIITVLKRSKAGPVHVLDDINTSIPERSWLSGMSESENLLKISGMALDNQTIAIFMKDLSNSNYVENVDLVEAKNSKHDGLNIKSFVLDTKINYAGRAKPATVAVISESSSSSAASSDESSSASAVEPSGEASSAVSSASAPAAAAAHAEEEQE